MSRVKYMDERPADFGPGTLVEELQRVTVDLHDPNLEDDREVLASYAYELREEIWSRMKGMN